MPFKPSVPTKKQGSPKSFRLSEELLGDLEKMAKSYGIKTNRLVGQALQYIVKEWKAGKNRSKGGK